MQKKNNIFMYSITVFAFLYSGTVIYCPFYASQSPVISFVLTSVAVLLYTAFAAAYFSKRNNMGRKGPAGFFAVILAVLAVVPMSSLAADYVRTLGTFADYYASAFTSTFAAAAVIFCAVYGASKGRICIFGFATLVFLLFAAWTATGFFAFLTTKNIVPLDAPFKDIAKTDWFSLVKNTAYVCLDVTLLAAVLCDNESEAARQVVPKAMMRGAAAFIVLSGVNVFRNLLLFGNKFACQIENPDLASIRLVPMFDLPEISVIVNTFASVLKMSAYACLILYALKDAFVHKYSSGKVSAAVVAASMIFCGIFYINGEKFSSANGFAMTCLTLCVILCYVFFSTPIKRQKNIK